MKKKESLTTNKVPEFKLGFKLVRREETDDYKVKIFLENTKGRNARYELEMKKSGPNWLVHGWYGKIGKTLNRVLVGVGDSPASAMVIMNKKMKDKLEKGYQIVKK